MIPLEEDVINTFEAQEGCIATVLRCEAEIEAIDLLISDLDTQKTASELGHLRLC